MKAIIMAGGEGTRLRPLTCDCPKPMVQFMNRPVMEHTIALLKKHSISNIAATLGYQPEAISDYFSDGEDFGVRIRYYIEKSPLGTAGGVRQAKDFLDETFIVLSGDGITDLDISSAVDFHRQKKAPVTIVLKEVDNPLDYGVVLTGEDGKVQAFFEKPDPSNMFSVFANTGVYIIEPSILDMIPADKPFDFGNDLFPRLVKENYPIYGYVMDGYWCDIGDIPAYLQAHEDALNGRIRLDTLPAFPDISIAPGCHISPDAIIESPCLIGSGACIEAGACVEPGSVIGANCRVCENARIKKSVVWQGAQIKSCAQAKGCVLAANAILESHASVYENAALGTGACVGARGTLLPGVRMWPGKQSPDGMKVEANLVWGREKHPTFASGRLEVSNPAQAMRLARACCASINPQKILLGRAADAPLSIWHGVMAGIMAQGVHVLDAGTGPLPVMRHALRTSSCDGALFIDSSGIMPLQPDGAKLSARSRRSILSLYARQDFPDNSPIQAEAAVLEATEEAYIARLCRCLPCNPANAPFIALSSPNPDLLRIGKAAFQDCGFPCRASLNVTPAKASPGEIGIWLDTIGESVVLSDDSGVLNDIEGQILIAWTALESGEKKIPLPVSATRTITTLAQRYGAKAEYISGEPGSWLERAAKEHPFQFSLRTDGLQCAFQTISTLLSSNLTLKQWRRTIPHASRQDRSIPVSVNDTGRILQSFARNNPRAQLGCGIRLERKNAWAWICPDESRQNFRIITESASAETARELCDFCEKELRRYSRRNPT